MISDIDYARAVAEFLSERGITRCPTVCLAPTRASVTDADRVALRSHAEIRETMRRERRRATQQLISSRMIAGDNGASADQPISDPHSAAGVSP